MNKIKIKNLLFSTTFILILSTVGCKFNDNETPIINIETINEEDNNNINKTEETISINITPITTPLPSPNPTTTPQIEETIIIKEDNRKLVALTFDDGPSKHTNDLIDILNSNDVKATFFVLGCNCDNYQDSLIKMSEYDHEIAIHGETHTSFTDLNINEIEDEIARTSDFIEELGIDVTNLVRPPYGSLNSKIKENIDNPFILWNIDTEDWKTRNKDKIKQEITDNIQEGSIILMHDTNAVQNCNFEALKELLPELTQEYKFVTISELFDSYNIELENGKTYRKIKSEN